MAQIDYDQVAAVYDTDRAVALQTQASWRVALADYLPPASGLPVLDLGAGTGLFAAAIAVWFDTKVIAVEPSEGMRQAARTRRADPIRSAFPDRVEPATGVEFWPGTRALLTHFPSSQHTIATFTAAGFSFQRLERVTDLLASSLRDYWERARARADSLLRQLPDEEFAEGLRRLERAAAAETTPTPMFRPLDLLVLQAPA